MTGTTKRGIQKKTYKFTNLAQYTTHTYYLSVTNAWSTAGIPSGAEILSATIRGWSGLGNTVNIGFDGDKNMYVFYQSGTTITSSSYITVQIVYLD